MRSNASAASLPPLLQAAHEGSLEAVRALLQKDLQAAHEGSLETVRTKLANTVDANGDSVLLHAAGLGAVVLVQQVLASGKSIEEALGQGVRVTAKGRVGVVRVEVAQLLIDSGADVNHHGQYGATPLTWAAFVGDLDMTQMLLRNGAEVNQADSWGDTALINAAKWSYRGAFPRFADTIRLLLIKGADPLQANNKGETARSIVDSRSREGGYGAVLRIMAGSTTSNATETTKDRSAMTDYT